MTTSKQKIQHIDNYIPPHSLEFETAILGALLLEGDVLNNCAEMLFPELFYDKRNETVCTAILRLYNTRGKVDILTVTEEVKRMELLESTGGAYYIASLTNRIASAANIEYHIRILQQYHIRRNAINVAHQMLSIAKDDATDVLTDLLPFQEKNMMELQNKLFSGRIHEFIDCYIELMKHQEVLKNVKEEITGVDTGFAGVNALTAGWQKTDLHILAARPGMGKTALALNYVKTAAKQGKPVAVFSLEMSRLQLAARLCSQETGVPLEKFLKKAMTDEETIVWRLKSDLLTNLPIYIDDTGGVDVNFIKSKARKLKREKNIQLIVIDYLQLMANLSIFKGDINNGISETTRQLKALAKELEIPIIVLSQLTREVEKRPGKRPQLSDLRDSGAIEQDADMVMFIFRPEYYDITQDGHGNSTRGKAEIIIAKNRNGGLNDVIVGFQGTCTNFFDLQPEAF